MPKVPLKLPKPVDQLTDKQLIFVQHFSISNNATASAKEAGAPPQSAHIIGHNWLRLPAVRTAIKIEKDRARERIEYLMDDAMQYWHDIAEANVVELMPHNSPCRYCWGTDNDFQYTLPEMRRKQREHRNEQMKLPENKRQLFDERGGIGYNIYGNPNPECPSCNGQGIYTEKTIDFNNLPIGLARLIKGYKLSQGRFELLLHDQWRAAENLQQLAGYLPNKAGSNTLPDPKRLTDDELRQAIAHMKTEIDSSPKSSAVKELVVNKKL